MIKSDKNKEFKPVLGTLIVSLTLLFLVHPFGQAGEAYSHLEDRNFLDGYKSILAKAAGNLRSKRVRLKAEITGYKGTEVEREALDKLRKEIEVYLREQYDIELISFVPKFGARFGKGGEALTPMISFSFFLDERLSLPERVEVAKVERPSARPPEFGEAAAIEKEEKKVEKVYTETELKSRRHNRAGIDYYKRGEYSRAFNEFIDAVISDPRNVQARFNLGVAYQLQGRYGEAIVELQKALQIKDMPRIHVMLGAVYIMQGRYNDALEELRNVVFFEYFSAKVGPEGGRAIKELAKIIKSGSHDASLRIDGHADSRGPDELNKRLSVERAIAVAMELVAINGVEPDSIFISGLGESDPIAPNSEEMGMRLNRRVEMIIQHNGDGQ